MDKKLIIRRLFKGILALMLIGALGAVTYIRATEEPVEAPSIEEIERTEGKAVAAVNPREQRFDDDIRADSTLRAPRRYVLRSHISEKVKKVTVDVGDTVGAGQLLVEFRKDDIASDINAAEARLEEAEKNFERFQNLLERGVVSEDAVESRLTALQDARAALRKARSRLEFTEVRSPAYEEFDYENGNVQVSARNVDPGEFKAAGQPLVTLTDMSVLDVEAHIPESAVRHLEYDQGIEFRLEHEDSWREAVVKRVSPETDDPHRFFTVYARTENVKEGGLWRLRPGMYAEVRISRDRRAAMAVPSGALRISEEGCCSIFVLEHDKKEAGENPRGGATGTAREVDIETGLRSEDWVEVLSPALNGEERIIMNPRLDLRDGDKVRVMRDAEVER